MEGIRSVAELRGIIPNSFAHIFGHMAKAEGDTRFLVSLLSFSYYFCAPCDEITYILITSFIYNNLKAVSKIKLQV